jgi:23S rRNA (guanosine2251-2'-O)-methyltransferase
MKKGVSEEGLIVGRNPVREALERGDGRIEKVMIRQGLTGHGIRQIRRLAKAEGVPVQQVPSARLSRLAPGVAHQGVAAVTIPVAYRDVEDMLHEIAADTDVVREKKPIVLLLDRIEDPHNFGAILRSAVAAGVEGVIVPRHRMAPLNAAAIKASAGVALRVPIARTGNLAGVIEQLKERGYWIAGASGTGETSVWEMDWDRPLALVIGNEERGLRPQIARACDYRVAIPMRGPAESLNASVAAGILLFAAARTRRP